jgi:hypothetical protein
MNALIAARAHLERAHELMNPSCFTVSADQQLEAERHRALAHDILELHRAELKPHLKNPVLTTAPQSDYPRVVGTPLTPRRT